MDRIGNPGDSWTGLYGIGLQAGKRAGGWPGPTAGTGHQQRKEMRQNFVKNDSRIPYKKIFGGFSYQIFCRFFTYLCIYQELQAS